MKMKKTITLEMKDWLLMLDWLLLHKGSQNLYENEQGEPDEDTIELWEEWEKEYEETEVAINKLQKKIFSKR